MAGELDAVARVGAWLRDAEMAVALTGAGVSTASGIPDFRGPAGVWTRDPRAEQQADIQHYLRDPDVRRAAWRRRIAVADAVTGPNAAHHAFVALEAAGILALLVTQNVDGLHVAAGTSPSRLVELHGTAAEVTCLDCEVRMPAGDVYARIRAGDDDPHCPACGGILKSATVSFGQPLRRHDVETAVRAAANADVFLAVGTSLGVYPAASLPELALDAGARVVIVNNEPTPLDSRADVVIHADTGRTMTAIAAAATSAI